MLENLIPVEKVGREAVLRLTWTLSSSIGLWSWAKRRVVFLFGEVLVATLFPKLPVYCSRLLPDGAHVDLAELRSPKSIS